MDKAFTHYGETIKPGQRYMVRFSGHCECIPRTRMTLVSLRESKSDGWVGQWRKYRCKNSVTWGSSSVVSALEGWDE